MKEKIKILDLETTPSQETSLQELSLEQQQGVAGGTLLWYDRSLGRWMVEHC
ncbi:MAG: hypothetical protein F6K56_26425 [Moorea sp. SIO3G5]|nr:hypothetical protein [Moorena sp. SIO3G5]